MASPFPPATRAQIEARFPIERDLLVRTLSAVGDLIARLDGRPMGGMTRVEFLVLFQSVKAFKTGQAIERLFFDGYQEDAEVLLRVLVEQAIVIRWVHQEDSDNRARAYALFLGEKQFARLRLIREVMPTLDLGRVPVAEIEKAHAEYERLPNKDRWRSLTGDVGKLAASSGMRASYLFYVYGTDFIHSNPTIEASYVREVGSETWFNTVASMPANGLTPVIVAQHLLFIADVLNDQFGLAAGASLRTLMDEAERPPAEH